MILIQRFKPMKCRTSLGMSQWMMMKKPNCLKMSMNWMKKLIRSMMMTILTQSRMLMMRIIGMPKMMHRAGGMANLCMVMIVKCRKLKQHSMGKIVIMMP